MQVAAQANEQAARNRALQHQFQGPPPHVKTEQFKRFLAANEASHNEGTGYMFIRLDKEDSFYRAGETVKGTVFFELFHQSAQNELLIKFEGLQVVPKHIKQKILCGVDSVDEDSSDSQEKSKNPRRSRVEDEVEVPDQEKLKQLTSSQDEEPGYHHTREQFLTAH